MLDPAADLAEPWRGLAGQVLANCRRADAEVAGRFSLCGLLLRLRNLYKWEHGLPPWQEPEPAAALEWVGRREDLWLEIMEEEPQPLSLPGQDFDPFDSDGVNAALRGQGLVYGAGRAGGLLPVFFLGRLENRQVVEGQEVCYVGAELGRDIFFLPGLRQDGRIYLRREPLGFLLWDKLADPRASLAPFLELALAGHGLRRRDLLANPSWEVFEPLLRGEQDTVLWHELGEADSGDAARELMLWAVEQYPASDLEHFVRGVKDLLADTGPRGRLARIIAAGAVGNLGFYPAWLAGFPRLLFPEADAAILQFGRDGDWAGVEEARRLGWERGRQALERLTDLAGSGLAPEMLLARARREIINPLTGGRTPPPRPD
ncbi:MAG: hypothetical protein LDL07_02615 [Desulfarculus sp.]|nr:hypothetical protein [Desulfarculus sp.]